MTPKRAAMFNGKPAPSLSAQNTEPLVGERPVARPAEAQVGAELLRERIGYLLETVDEEIAFRTKRKLRGSVGILTAIRNQIEGLLRPPLYANPVGAQVGLLRELLQESRKRLAKQHRATSQHSPADVCGDCELIAAIDAYLKETGNG